VQLDDKNYSNWSYVLKIFLRGKSMWDYISGAKAKLIDTKGDDYATALKV